MKIFRVALALTMVAAGSLHFIAPGGYVSIMPNYLPFHRELVYLSGLAEISLGIGLLWQRLRQLSGIGLILLFVAVLPANVNMALENIQPFSFTIPAFWLWARVPFQLVFIFWAWRVSRPDAVDG